MNGYGRLIDLRSDTVTRPTQEMREAMARAEVGDDGYGEDPTVKRLEQTAAKLLGKEDALFIPSGTFGNQLAMLIHCRRGDEVILEENCHIVVNEMGASGIIPGVQLRTVPTERGLMSYSDVESRIRGTGGLHSPRTGLICLENTHSSGEALSQDYMESLYELARSQGIPLHLDGARLFNACAATDAEPEELARFADTVLICLSKGLCAPVGSLLAGDEEFIREARRGRQIMGGGMRQAGVLAAPGIVALERMRDRLAEDHENARLLEKLLSVIPGIRLRYCAIPTNMVYFRLEENVVQADVFIRALHSREIRLNPPNKGWYRLVTHNDISAGDISNAARVIFEMLAQLNSL